jgi:hypothetical protein
MMMTTHGAGAHIGVLVGMLEGKRPLEWPRRRWMDNMKMSRTKVRWGGMD